MGAWSVVMYSFQCLPLAIVILFRVTCVAVRLEYIEFGSWGADVVVLCTLLLVRVLPQLDPYIQSAAI